LLDFWWLSEAEAKAFTPGSKKKVKKSLYYKRFNYIFEKPSVMKNRLSSIAKYFTGSESCAICAIAVTVLAVVVIWKVISLVQGHVEEYVAMQDMSLWRR
jgi:hypothetical protein